MPFLILAGLVLAGCAFVFYFNNNSEKYTRSKKEKKDPEDPAEVIYLFEKDRESKEKPKGEE